MTARANRRKQQQSDVDTDKALRSVERVETWPDGDWVVRPVTGAAATKNYRCPGCDQEIRPATPHLVAWPAESGGGPDERRHWHKPCWAARGRRGVKVHRARNAPRYR